MLDTVKKISEEHFALVTAYPVKYGEDRLVWLLQPLGNSRAKPRGGAYTVICRQALAAAEGVLGTIHRSCMELAGLEVSFVLYDAPVYLGQFAWAVRSLEEMVELAASEQPGIVITDERRTDAAEGGVFPERGFVRPYTAEKAGAKLKNLLSFQKYDEFETEITKLCQVIRDFDSRNNTAAQELYHTAATLILSHINQKGIMGQIAFKIDMAGLLRPYEAGSWKNAADYLQKLSGIISQIQKNKENHTRGYVVDRMTQYIDQHIEEDLSLTQLSRLTGYNASYLSRVFKQKTGVTVNEYICRQKLVRINAYLADDALSIRDVAARTGFSSRTYFNNFFKRMMGMSPKEYRMILWQK